MISVFKGLKLPHSSVVSAAFLFCVLSFLSVFFGIYTGLGPLVFQFFLLWIGIFLMSWVVIGKMCVKRTGVFEFEKKMLVMCLLWLFYVAASFMKTADTGFDGAAVWVLGGVLGFMWGVGMPSVSSVRQFFKCVCVASCVSGVWALYVLSEGLSGLDVYVFWRYGWLMSLFVCVAFFLEARSCFSFWYFAVLFLCFVLCWIGFVWDVWFVLLVLFVLNVLVFVLPHNRRHTAGVVKWRFFMVWCGVLTLCLGVVILKEKSWFFGEAQGSVFWFSFELWKAHAFFGSTAGYWPYLYGKYDVVYANVLNGMGVDASYYYASHFLLGLPSALGWFGVFLFFGLLGVVCWCFWAGVGRLHRKDLWFFIGVFSGCLVLMVGLFFQFLLWGVLESVLFGVCVGLLSSGVWWRKARLFVFFNGRWSAVWGWLLRVVFLFVFVSMLPMLYGRLRLEQMYQQAVRLELSGDAKSAADLARLGWVRFGDRRFWQVVGDAEVALKNYEQALNAYDVFLNMQPYNLTYLWRRLQLLFFQGDQYLVKVGLLRFLDLDPFHLEGLKLAVVVFEDEPSRQLDFLYRLSRLTYGHVFLKLLSRRAFDLKSWKKLVWALENILQYDLGSPRIYGILSFAYRMLGDFQKAKFYDRQLIDEAR